MSAYNAESGGCDGYRRTVHSARCACGDPGCDFHKGASCDAEATETLYRVDMIDRTGTPFCLDCCEDAMDCGLFSTDPTCGGSSDFEMIPDRERAAAKRRSVSEGGAR